jgi:hypothetical protein
MAKNLILVSGGGRIFEIIPTTIIAIAIRNNKIQVTTVT